MDPKISIVVPVFNEENTVDEVMGRIKKTMASCNCDFEIIAVNDKSKDKSKEILEKIEGIRVINNQINQGYGSSLKRGITAAKYDWILITDADGTYPVEDIPRLIKESNHYDMVIGARVGKHVKIPLIRKPAKLFLRMLANYISPTKIPDINSGLRLFKKEVALKYWNLLPKRFSFTTTITLACTTREEYSVKFIPINYYKRQGKSSMKPIQDFLKFLNLTLKLCLYFKPLKIFLPTGLILLVLGMILGIYRAIQFLDVSESSLFFVLSGLQIIFMGFLAHMIVETRK
jgi:glycosyltransferase involved in cell wall biosynthesis